MIPTFFAAGPGILIVIIPLMVIVPACVILIVRRITGAPGDDSFRLRTSSRPPKSEPSGAELDDEF